MEPSVNLFAKEMILCQAGVFSFFTEIIMENFWKIEASLSERFQPLFSLFILTTS